MSTSEPHGPAGDAQTTDDTARVPDWSPASHELDGPVGGGSRGTERLADYDRLRESCPVAWSEDWGGYWTLARYQDVTAAALKHQTFRSGQPFVQLPDFTQSIPIGLNPPEHATYRRALNKYFVPDRMHELEPSVRAHVTRHLDPILERGHAEMVTEFCAPVPARGLASLLNLPDDAWEELVGHLDTVEELARTDRTALNTAMFEVFAGQVRRVVAERRERPLDPDKDVISGILALRVDGESLDDDTVTGIGVMLIAAGHGTTQDALAGSLFLLATNPGDQARLRRDPSLIPTAVEEFLRLDPPGHEFGRRAAHDVEMHGRTIKEGEFVALNYAAANRDEEQFPNPSACIIDRTPNRHLSFGHGVHKCAGAPLGRLEIRVALEEILGRTRSFELDGVPEPGLAVHLGGLGKLPLRFKLP